MKLHNSSLGLTFTSLKLQAAEIIAKRDQFYLRNLDEIYFNEEIDFIKDKETKITALIQSAFEELSLKNSFVSDVVSFSVPRELFITAILPIEQSLLHTDLLEEFRWRLSVMYPFYNWYDFVIRYYEIKKKSILRDESAIVFSLHRKYLKILHNLCSKNNLKLRFIDHCHLSSNNILIMHQADKKADQLSFYISQRILSVLITAGGTPVYYEDIPLTIFHEIPELIKGKIEELRNNQFNFTDAVLFGESSSNTLTKVLTESTNINFRLINPFSHLKAEENLLTNVYFTETNHFFSPSAGAVVRI